MIGAIYLVWLGVHALRAAWTGRIEDGAPAAAEGARRHPLRALRQGFVTNLSNPKIAVFFTSFLPQFAGSDATVVTLFALGLFFCLMGFVWMASIGVFVAKAGDVLRRPRIRRAMEGATGAVLIAFGIRLATTDR